jgi:signal transduction histidine kinase
LAKNMHQDIESLEVIDTGFLQSATRQASLLLRASGSAFYVCKAAQEPIELAASYGIAPESCAEGLLGQVCEVRQAMMATQPGTLTVLAVPSVWRDTLHGVLVVTGDLPDRTFDEQDAALLQSLAEMTAAALHQAERLTRMTAQFRALHTIDIALTSSLQLDRVLNLILEKATGLVGAEHGSLRLLNPETGELVLKAHLGEGWTPEVRAYTFQSGHGIVGWVAENLQPYLCPNAHTDPQNILLFEEMRSGVAVPLLRKPGEAPEQDELLGVLLLESTRLAAFDQQDVELLEALAQEAIIAIQNATQHHELQLMHNALQDEQERRIAAEKWTVMGQAATALAHRINNLIGILPVSAAEIRRTISRLEIPGSDKDWLEANLRRIERNGQFILRLADALFRPFQEPGPRARFDVNRLLNEALRAASLPPSIQVTRQYGEDLPAVESNSLLVDIFLELITNARQAMEGQPRAELDLCTGAEENGTGAWVTVEISDTGRGIAPDQMAHLWDMFKQSDGGLGFGLWWVRTFLERQGGTISCHSKPGAGATFSVRLPVHAGAEATQARLRGG